MALLLESLDLRGVTLSNRIAISPMCQYASAGGGMAGRWHSLHYGRFALGGAGLVMVECSAVAETGRITHGDLGIWSDAQIEGLAAVADSIAIGGSVPGIQIGHSGRKGSYQRPWHGLRPLGPVDLQERGETAWPTVSVTDESSHPNAPAPGRLSELGIAEIVSQFADAARRARQAGFRMLEIHGAHGYLIHSFLSPLANMREDEYGGDFERRIRFAREVCVAVRSQWPDEYPLSFRVSSTDASPDGWNMDDSVRLARDLAGLGVDLIDCSSGGIGKDLSVIPRGPGFQVAFSERIRRQAGVKTIAVGLITEASQAEAILRNEQADIIAVAREALINPNWPLQATREFDTQTPFSHWPPRSGWWLANRKMT